MLAPRSLVCLAAAAILSSLAPGFAAAAETKTVHKLAGLEIEATADIKGLTLDLGAEALAPGLDVVTLKLESATPAPPPKLALRFAIPSHDVAGQWTPGRHFDKGIKPDWARSRLEASMFARNAPVVALFGADNHNVLTFA